MTATRFFPVVSIFALMAGMAACSAASVEENVGRDEATERWDSFNNPARVDTTFVYNAMALPLEGATAQALIPADYWATARDSINARWDGDELSPAEKFGQAFGKGAETVGLAVSKDTGIRAQTNRVKCTKEGTECSALTDGSVCSIPRGEAEGRCIPTWWGICHGWAPYAFSEPVAKNPVTKNGVTFYAADLEALMSLVYSRGLPTKFLSQRCNGELRPGGSTPPSVTTDADGRVVESQCLDMNPGSFHVVATNMLGLQHKSFVEDRTFDAQVWNQPVRDYKITNAEGGKLKEITKEQAIALFGVAMSFTEIQAKVTLKKGETKAGVYTATTAGELTFKSSGTGDAELFVKKGSEASATSNDCASTGGSSAEECRVTVAVGDQIHFQLLGYAETSDIALSVGSPLAAASTYKFNRDAKRFFHVQMDFRYISEPGPSRTPANPDHNTSTDRYEYILEADQSGTIMGGEWLGASRTNHPDFVWWPTAKPNGTFANGLITYAEVKALNDEAAGPQPVVSREPVVKVLLADQAIGTTTSKPLSLYVPARGKLALDMTGTGNADLTVYLGSSTRPVCRSTARDTSTESCKLTAPTSGASYLVVVTATNDSTVTLTSTVTP